MLCVLTFREKEFGRPFDTFVPRSARLVIHFDACLTGLGIILFEKGEAADGSDDVLMGGCAGHGLVVPEHLQRYSSPLAQSPASEG